MDDSELADGWDMAFARARAMPQSVRGEAKPDATYVSQASMKPQTKARNLAFPLWDIASDYTGNNLGPAAVAGGAIDVALTKGSRNPILGITKGATGALNFVPRYIYGDDFWKNLGEENRKYYNDQMNKLKSDLYSTFIMPPIDY
jgi:hypothetical protein